MFAKLTSLIAIGSAALVSANAPKEYSIDGFLNPATDTKVGDAPPAGFLADTIFDINQAQRQWLYDQLPVKNSPGVRWYRNGDVYAFERAATYKKSVLFLARSEKGALFGAFTQARLEYSRWDSNDYTDANAFLFNLDFMTAFKNKLPFHEIVETENTGSYRWIFFASDFTDSIKDFYIRVSDSNISAGSVAGLPGFMVTRNPNGNNDILREIDRYPVRVNVLEMWEF
jgi:hypothetical protein